jgi:CDP-paratose 2-epimerase
LRVLITGGAGFVGANLSVGLAARHPDWELVALDNLHRAGSELNLPRLQAAGVQFVRADVREREQLRAVEGIDALVECSAEPSALTGFDGSTDYAVHTNLLGAHECLELARREGAQLVFLSTSRVYPYQRINSLALEEGPTRFELSAEQEVPGASAAGISERFPLDGPRTLYGSTKLAAELLIAEYAAAFGLRAVVDRCGVIAGPWQMGRVDQGVFSFWMLSHHFGVPLTYIGQGGAGKQVRDLLHVDDLIDLIDEQLVDPDRWAGVTVNVGGGAGCSLSLLEATAICRELTGREVPIEGDPADRPGDVACYLSDCGKLHGLTGWRPRRGAREAMEDIHGWISDHDQELAEALQIAPRAAAGERPAVPGGGR